MDAEKKGDRDHEAESDDEGYEKRQQNIMSVYRPSYRDPKSGKLKRQAIWWYAFTFAGRRVQESSKTTRKTIAVEMEKKRRLELEQVYAGVSAKPQQRIRTVTLAIKEYQTAYAVTHRQKATAWVRERSQHVLRILGNALLSDLTENRIAEYMAQRLAEGVGHRTVNMEMECLARSLGGQWRVLWPKLKRLEEPRDTGLALEPEEEQRLLDFAAVNRSPMVLPFLRIALSTGMRFSEIRTMKWIRIDLEKRILIVGQSKTAAGTGRGLPMNESLYRTLTAHAFWVEKKLGRPPAPDEYLFPFSKHAGPLDPTRPILGIKSAWESVRDKAGVDCRFHDLRHTAYSKLDAAEVPEQVIMALMGHVSKSMRERYSHARMDAMREAVKHLELDNTFGLSKESTKVSMSGGTSKTLTH
jgi:integrase